METTIKAENLTETIKDFLDESGKKVLAAPSIYKLLNLNDDKERSVKWVCRYFGVTTNSRSEGAYKLSKIINAIGKKYNVQGILSGPVQIELYVDSVNSMSFASVIYVALNPSDAIKSESNRWNFKLGATPEIYLSDPEEIEFCVTNEKLKELDLMDENS